MIDDLRTIKMPFGMLDPETQEALKSWRHGLQVYSGGGWQDWDMTWSDDKVYRANPEIVTKPSIDWSHVAPEWRWMAQDKDQSVYLYRKKPIVWDDVWDTREVPLRITGVLTSLEPGNCHWRSSLVERPEEVDATHEDLAAKLAKAVEALERISDIDPSDTGVFHDIANQTLAELKGGKDE